MNSTQKRKQRYVEQGLCSRCGEKPLKTKTMCEECARYHTERYNVLRQELLQRGLCVRCEKRPLKSETMCEPCLAQQKTAADKRKTRYSNAGNCTKCGIRPLHTKRVCEVCNNKEIARNQATKDKVFAHYGGYICACCGETEEAFLSIDHINDDGASHRKTAGSGSRFYWWVVRNNFPPGLQVLCWNCQWGKRKFGTCPHQHKTNQAPCPPSVSHDTSGVRLQVA